jgi:hypothetical protein
MLEVAVLFFIIILLLVIIQIVNNENTVNTMNASTSVETFSDLKACPSGFKGFYDSNGNRLCGSGEMITSTKNSGKVCILNGPSTNQVPNCVRFLQEEYNRKGKDICPPSMKNYFENKLNKTSGCTNGPLNDSMTGPRNIQTQFACKIFPTQKANINSGVSCYNSRLLDMTPCFGRQCSKRIIQPNAKAPPLISIQFNDDMGIPRLCYTRQSLINYLNVVQPQWRERGIDLSKNIMVAEVARAVYVDKTMTVSATTSNIQL